MTRTDWNLSKTKKRLQRRRERWIARKIAKGVLIAGLIGVACVFTGAYDGPQRLVEDEYIVQPHDTLWSIGETYMAKNTGGRRYILEFIDGIKELNPELLESKGQVQPGQKIRINYWVKTDDGEER